MSTHFQPPGGRGMPPPQYTTYDLSPEQQSGPGISVTGIAAYGTLIQVLSATGTPDVYTSIAGVGDITGPGTTIAEAETTSHSTGAPVRTFIPTLIDPGELGFPCFWNPSDPTQAISSPYGLEYLFWNRVITKFQLVMTDSTHRTRQFQGYVKSISETYPLAGICTRNAAIRIITPMTDVPTSIKITPSTVAATSAGGPGTSLALTAGGSTAPWIAVSDVSWITVLTPVTSTVGDASITYSVAAQLPAAPARTGHINVAALGLTCTINQAIGT